GFRGWGQRGGGGGVGGWEGGEGDGVHAGEGGATDTLLQPLRQRLHLGKLGHPLTVPGARQPTFLAPALSAYVDAPFVHAGPFPQLRRGRFFCPAGGDMAPPAPYSFRAARPPPARPPSPPPPHP